MAYWKTPLTLHENNKCIPVEIPDSTEWMSLFLGALDDLSHEYNWEETIGGLTPYETANQWRKIMYELIGKDCVTVDYPRYQFLPGSLARKIFGAGSIVTEYSSLYMLGQRTYLTTPAVGDKWEYYFNLAAGSYQMRHVIQRPNSSNGCTVDWFIDGQLVVDNMSFLGSAANIQVNNVISILESGQHVLSAEVVAIQGSAQPAPIHYIQFVDNVIPA